MSVLSGMRVPCWEKLPDEIEKRRAAEVVEERGVRVGKFISISWDGESQFLVF